MAGRVFRPTSLTIDAGQAVVFLNDDDRDTRPRRATARSTPARCGPGPGRPAGLVGLLVLGVFGVFGAVIRGAVPRG
jgi:hypothetical protein